MARSISAATGAGSSTLRMTLNPTEALDRYKTISATVRFGAWSLPATVDGEVNTLHWVGHRMLAASCAMLASYWPSRAGAYLNLRYYVKQIDVLAGEGKGGKNGVLGSWHVAQLNTLLAAVWTTLLGSYNGDLTATKTTFLDFMAAWTEYARLNGVAWPTVQGWYAQSTQVLRQHLANIPSWQANGIDQEFVSLIPPTVKLPNNVANPSAEEARSWYDQVKDVVYSAPSAIRSILNDHPYATQLVSQALAQRIMGPAASWALPQISGPGGIIGPGGPMGPPPALPPAGGSTTLP
ncbi:MAG: hypothetical protein E6R08_01350 [Nevskiaceae bacterium]|nr:MAG: hypothetical protein E6R08_01350 [Nevskiaceae bacterium]